MFCNWKIGVRLRLGFSVLMLFTLIIGGVSIYEFNLTTQKLKVNLTYTIEKLNTIKDLEKNSLITGYNGAAAIVAPDERESKRFIDNFEKYRPQVYSLEKKLFDIVENKLSSDKKQEQSLLKKISNEKEEISLLFQQARGYKEKGDYESAIKLLNDQIIPKLDNYHATMSTISHYYEDILNKTSQSILVHTETSSNILIALLIISIILSFLISRTLTNGIIKPLKHALETSEAIASRKFHRVPLTNYLKDEIGQLLKSMDIMQRNLILTIEGIGNSANQVFNASQEMNQRNHELSSRTEKQASSLEETALTIEELSTTIEQNSANLQNAALLADTMNKEAQSGANLVSDVVKQMSAIKSSSDKISQITSVIDGIAFQTNILALNAAVEAARAGEHGRGFAVVASEVRTLSQKSAQAAKEIRHLIDESAKNVGEGQKSAHNVANKIQDISKGFQSVTELISQINTATQEQNYGIKQIHESISNIDSMTQKNASLVEESSTVSDTLSQQSKLLHDNISGFKIF